MAVSSFEVAVVQPLTAYGEGSREVNLERARQYVLEAARRGAKIVCLPETYPGEWRKPVRWTPAAELAEIAREAGVYLIGGFCEPVDEEGARCYMTEALFDPDGREVGRYRRTTPAHDPWIYKGGTYWDVDWTKADELPVFETELGKIGILICSEVYVPELSRILALQGAELVFMPAGVPKGTLFDTWRTLMWARAIENLMYTATCQNLKRESDQGMAMICSPERIVVESTHAGVYIGTVDLERIRWLREEQDRWVQPFPWYTKPGIFRDWRRTELFAKYGLVRQEAEEASSVRR